MKQKTQRAWAIVGHRGWINHSTIRFCRKDVISDQIAEFRSYPRFVGTHPNLTDAQFWRVIKRKRGVTVRRVTLKVAR